MAISNSSNVSSSLSDSDDDDGDLESRRSSLSNSSSPPSPPSPWQSSPPPDDSESPLSSIEKSPPSPSPSPSPPSQSPPPPSPSSDYHSDSLHRSMKKSHSPSSPSPSPSPSPPSPPPSDSPLHSPSPSPPPPPPEAAPPPSSPNPSSPLPPKGSPPHPSPPPPSPPGPAPVSSPPPPAPVSSPPPPAPPPPRLAPAPMPTPITPPPSPSTPPPSLASPVSPPPPLPPTGSAPNRPITPPQSPPVYPAPPSRSSGASSPESQSSSSPSGGSSDHIGQHVGFALAGFFILAFIALILFFILRRKKDRGDVYLRPQDADVHYYIDKPGAVNGPQDGFYGSQPLHSAPATYGNGSHAVGMHHFETPSDPGQQMSAGPIAFSYDKIAEITNDFSSANVIGEGGFGCVYKASMPDGRVGAVKMLKAGSGQGEREFRAEVEIISRVHHRHLVSLIGYCISEQQRMLIYEFVPNGNLNQHLHGSDIRVLDWPKRIKIANGAARGLAYLHEGCNPKIIHRDIKSANILLDDAYEAQVADFGLARLTDDANTHVSTRVMGTFGYMAPEYATSGKLTDRSDVFSFGVVLLELITGRKPVDPTQPVGDESLVEWARPLLLHAMETREFGDLVDSRLEGHYVESEMFRMIEAAAACVRHSAPKRPRMVQVARALDSGDRLDLSNGVKYGQSTVYDSGQYNDDIMRFRRMANGSFNDSDFDMYSTEYSSREMSSWMPGSSGEGNPESVAFHNHRISAEHKP